MIAPMTEPHVQPPVPDEAGDATWFRAPTAREHRIAGWLFVGFGVFFLLLFILHVGWWFRWFILGFGAFSVVRGTYHLRQAARLRRQGPQAGGGGA